MLAAIAWGVAWTSAHATQPASPPSDGPWSWRVMIATSDDGLAFTSRDAAIGERVGTPDIVEIAAATPKPGLALGDWLIVGIDGRTEGHSKARLCAIRSTDGGTTWSAPASIEVADWPDAFTARSVSVVQLADGRVRAYLEVEEAPAARDPDDPGRPIGVPPKLPVHPTIPSPPAKPEWPGRPGEPPRTIMPIDESTRRILSVVSDDGSSFTIEPGLRLDGVSFADPDVLRAGDRWLMWLTRGQDVVLARSTDGLSFSVDAGFALGGWHEPAAVGLADGRVRLFGTTRDGIVSGIVDPQSMKFEREPGWRAIRPVADASVSGRSAGGFVMVFSVPIDVNLP